MTHKQPPRRPLPAAAAPKCCRACGAALTAPKPRARGMCRSCWRVHRVLVAG